MDAAPQTDAPKPAFDFGAMKGVASAGTSEATPSVDDGPDMLPELPAAEAVPAPKDDEDDLDIGGQLDIPAPATPDAQAPAATSPAASPETPADGTSASMEGSVGEDAGQPGEAGEQHDQTNPDDPRLAALAAAARQQEDQARQARQGGGGGGSPGLTGLVAGAAGASASLVRGGFKMLHNGVREATGYDPSKPKPMTVGERLATRDPVKAEAYWSKAGDKRVRENYYRENFNATNDALVEASRAKADVVAGTREMADVLNASPLRQMAEAADTSVGDFINRVKGGTVKDAAAVQLVNALSQDPAFKAAETKVVDAANRFSEKRDAALKHMDALDNAFPGRADTSIKKQQLSDMSSDMQNDEIKKASDRVKKVLDDIDSIAKALKEAIKKTIDQVASVFRPK